MKTKPEQEAGVGWVLLQEYEALSGAPLSGNEPSIPDPPDRLFHWRGIPLGAELFEFPRAYELRALRNALTNATYAAFEDRDVGDRYLGMTVHLMDTRGRAGAEIQARWTDRGIRDGVKRAARELVDLMLRRLASREALPQNGPVITPNAPPVPGMKWWPIDASDTPALAEVCTDIACIRTAAADIRRSDGRAAPLVIFSGSGEATPAEMLIELVQGIRGKMGRRWEPTTGWSAVKHAMLVVHDLPRGRIYEPLPLNAVELVRAAAELAGVLEAFDELLFVTYQDRSWKAIRIAGGPPKGYEVRAPT